MNNNVRELVKNIMNYIDENRNIYDDNWQDVKHLYNIIMSHTACIINPDGSISATPCEGIFPYMDKLCEYVEKNISNSQDINYFEIKNIIINFLSIQVERDKEYLKSHKLNDYYGDYKYIKERLETINDAINMIYNDERSLPVEKELIESYIPEIKKIEQSILSYNNTKESYLHDVSEPYKRLLDIEKDLSKIVVKRWHEFAVNRNAKLIHFLRSDSGQDFVKSDDMSKICTSLYTDDLKSHICSFRHVGYFYDFDFENIFAIGYKDLGSWTVTKNDFIGIGEDWDERKYNPIAIPRWQYNSETNCWLEDACNTILFLPEYVEKKATENDSTYTEIYINNMKEHKIKPTACFYTEDATLDEIVMIKKLAAKQNIPVQSINVNNIDKSKWKL